MKFGLGLLAVGIIAFAIYSLTSQPDYNAMLEVKESSIHALINSCEIYPKTAHANNSLQIRMAEGTREHYNYLSVRWIKNGHEIPGVSGTILDSKYVNKHDNISAEVNLLGPDKLDEPVEVPSVHVDNSRPVLRNVVADIRQSPSDIIVARVDAVDADNDNLKVSYRWSRNGTYIEGANGAQLGVNGLERGDEVVLEVMVSDGDDQTPWVKAPSVSIGSNAPEITSQPPTTLTKDHRFVYKVIAEGPDPDALVFSLLKAPPGMKITPTGEIDWAVPEAERDEKTYEVSVQVADDTGGIVIQDFSIGVKKKEQRGW